MNKKIKRLPVSPEEIDSIVDSAVFEADEQVKEKHRQAIRELASKAGAFPASIQGLYEAAAKGLYHHKTVPAINIRGLTYQVARAVFRAALKHEVGALIFEIARSEIGYTGQRPAEYSACVLAAAVREGFKGPVFIQGDHFQVNRKYYTSEPDKEIGYIKGLIKEAITAQFYNIDVDASTLVDLDKPTLEAQQEMNCKVTADMTKYIRSIQPEGITVSVGGEIGEVGKKNSTVEDLDVFMKGYTGLLGKNIRGISKISVQTGTKHGGLVLPDGSVAKVKLDFNTLEALSKAAKQHGLGGAVQHGASTLPDEAFDFFPKADTVEVHLATGFQNIIYDSPYFPKELLVKIYKYVKEKHSGEKKAEDTDEQFLYENRKRAFGPFKREMWNIPEENMAQLMGTLEDRFSLLFQKLNVVNTVDLVKRYVA